MTAREALLRWARRSTARYPGVRVNDFTGSWRDGLAFSALIHRNRPDLIDWRDVRQRRTRERLETAFHVVEKEYGVTRLLDPEGKIISTLFIFKCSYCSMNKKLVLICIMLSELYDALFFATPPHLIEPRKTPNDE